MAPDEFGIFMFQFIGGWGSLAFLFLLITFAFNPPKFNYVLKRQGQAANRQRFSVIPQPPAFGWGRASTSITILRFHKLLG